jgi:AcrR family transcriptional regulator
MTRSATPVEDTIITAAIECIEEFGITGTTNHRITARADWY